MKIKVKKRGKGKKCNCGSMKIQDLFPRLAPEPRAARSGLETRCNQQIDKTWCPPKERKIQEMHDFWFCLKSSNKAT